MLGGEDHFLALYTLSCCLKMNCLEGPEEDYLKEAQMRPRCGEAGTGSLWTEVAYPAMPSRLSSLYSMYKTVMFTMLR
jgi:hypothetical protein